MIIKFKLFETVFENVPVEFIDNDVYSVNVGDLVICIDATQSEKILECGETYIIESFNEKKKQQLILQNVKHFWDLNRFIFHKHITQETIDDFEEHILRKKSKKYNIIYEKFKII